MSFAETTGLSPNRFETEDFTRSVHALFDDQAEADKARQDLIAAGIAHDAITVHSNGGIDVSEPQPEPGFWERMISLFVPDDDRQSFAEGVRRGGVAIEVRTDTANYDRVVDILDRDGAVDLDERQESWRRDGWHGYTGQDPLAEGSPTTSPVAAGEEEPRYTPPSAATAGFGASSADHFPLVDDAAPLIESPGAVLPDMLESAPRRSTDATPGQAWSRDTSHGRTRVRTYVPVPNVTGPAADR